MGTGQGQLTFAKLAFMEPRLKNLDLLVSAVVRTNRDADVFCATNYWHLGAEPFAQLLVGRFRPKVIPFLNADDEVLRSERAYVVVCQHFWSKLPSCRNCQCTSRKTETATLKPVAQHG